MGCKGTGYNKILFIDFDGTITSEDTLDRAMRLTTDSKLYEKRKQEMLKGKTNISEALHAGFSTIPSYKIDIILDYVRSVPIRSGFGDLLQLMKTKNIPVVVISGGLKPYIEEKLEPYKKLLLNIHSVDVDFSGEYLRLASDYDVDGEIMQKTLVMKEYDYKYAMCIGDSYTDFNMARASQLVFARGILKDYLEKQGVFYVPWNDFHDVKNFIKSRI